LQAHQGVPLSGIVSPPCYIVPAQPTAPKTQDGPPFRYPLRYQATELPAISGDGVPCGIGRRSPLRYQATEPPAVSGEEAPRGIRRRSAAGIASAPKGTPRHARAGSRVPRRGPSIPVPPAVSSSDGARQVLQAHQRVFLATHAQVAGSPGELLPVHVPVQHLQEQGGGGGGV